MTLKPSPLPPPPPFPLLPPFFLAARISSCATFHMLPSTRLELASISDPRLVSRDSAPFLVLAGRTAYRFNRLDELVTMRHVSICEARRIFLVAKRSGTISGLLAQQISGIPSVVANRPIPASLNNFGHLSDDRAVQIALNKCAKQGSCLFQGLRHGDLHAQHVDSSRPSSTWICEKMISRPENDHLTIQLRDKVVQYSRYTWSDETAEIVLVNVMNDTDAQELQNITSIDQYHLVMSLPRTWGGDPELAKSYAAPFTCGRRQMKGSSCLLDSEDATTAMNSTRLFAPFTSSTLLVNTMT